MSVASGGKTLIFVPGYGDVTQAMLQRLREVRHKKPMANMPEERFRELVGIAERQLASAREIEEQAAQGVPFAVEAYTRRCDEARRAIWTTYDEPLARIGAGFGETQARKAGKKRGVPAIHESIQALAHCVGDAKSELWPLFMAELGKRRVECWERTTPSGELQLCYVDDESGRKGTITLSRFVRLLGKARKSARR